MELLRRGQDLLSVEQFARALAEGDCELLMTSHGFALISWGESTDGRTMNILTVTTTWAEADIGIQEIEEAAKERGAKSIITVGRVAWAEFLKNHGYEVQRTILARKVIHGNSIS